MGLASPHMNVSHQDYEGLAKRTYFYVGGNYIQVSLPSAKYLAGSFDTLNELNHRVGNQRSALPRESNVRRETCAIRWCEAKNTRGFCARGSPIRDGKSHYIACWRLTSIGDFADLSQWLAELAEYTRWPSGLGLVVSFKRLRCLHH